MIGQGKVEASPLAMAMVAAAVDSGVARTPTLLPGEAAGQASDEPIRAKVAPTSADDAARGDPRHRHAVNLPGLPVFAKTGTAEFAQGHGHRRPMPG